MYIVPKNVKTRFVFFGEFGWYELLITTIGIVIGGILLLIFGFFTKSIFRFVLLVVGAAVGYQVSYRNPRTGLSLLKLLKNFKEFKAKAQTYYYSFGEGRVRNG